MVSNSKPDQNRIVFSGFRCNVLPPGLGETWFQNGSLEPARPCCFPVLRGAFCTENRLREPARPAVSLSLQNLGRECVW